jgi:hypothetical protein
MATFQGKVLIGDLEVEATVSEQHSVQIDVTDFPVEHGANISDHKRVKPDSIRIEGIISNTPIAKQEQLPDNYGARVQKAFEYLEKLRDSGDLIVITTGLKLYQDMALVDAQIPRDVKTGDVLQFTASFKQIRVVSNRTVSVVTTRAPNGQPLNKKGPQPTKEADESLKLKSILARGDDELAGGKITQTLRKALIGH